MNYEPVVIIILIILLPAMFLLGLVAKKSTYKPFVIRSIKAVQGEDSKTWTFEYPFNVSENTHYIFIVDMPKGQDNKKGL